MNLSTTMRGVLPVLLLSFAVPGKARAQEDTPPLDAARIPTTGARVQDFVPSGWKVAHQVTGDLNGDGRADRALHIVPRSSEWYDPEGVSAAPGAHAVVVLVAEANGRLRRGGVTTRLLETEVPQYIYSMSVRRGVLIVEQNYGMTRVTDVTWRFRWDAERGRFLLIGRDQFFYTRPQEADESVKRSENYLTGVRLITTGRFSSTGRYSEASRSERIPRTLVAMEDLNELAP